MIENLPSYVDWVFVLTTAFTIVFFIKSGKGLVIAPVIILMWLLIQALISINGFYTITDTIPPRFPLLVLPPLLLIIILFVTKKGRIFIDHLNQEYLTYLHIVRVPVEIVLLWLFLHDQVPQLMTFEGRNFDIVSGASAPFVAYFGYRKKKLSSFTLLCWNVICLGLLFNIVINAILSAPSPFQQFAFDQPNVGVLYFPFVWLPGFIVPMVLFAHLVCIRRLILKK